MILKINCLRSRFHTIQNKVRSPLYPECDRISILMHDLLVRSHFYLVFDRVRSLFSVCG
ncbi:hypothetical protein [Calothrix sp. PCC 6303]|uniref:hypothetical protein n=1 Tax=Calothrix sp. PCC 6303 TaxID=1170562 RepID=UPI0003155FB0|nr:hypothetical protein [Calothrix sp. PCC 6303]